MAAVPRHSNNTYLTRRPMLYLTSIKPHSNKKNSGYHARASTYQR